MRQIKLSFSKMINGDFFIKKDSVGGVTDHTLLSNIGTNTHPQIDTHIADTTLHFTEGSIDHVNILSIGSNSHSAIDTHIADTTLHFTIGSKSIGDLSDVDLTGNANNKILKFNSTSGNFEIADDTGITDHTLLSNIGTNSHSSIDTHLASTSNPHSVTLAQVGGTNDHTALSNIGSNSHSAIDTHIADNSQAHSDYLINNGNDTTTGVLTATSFDISNNNGYLRWTGVNDTKINVFKAGDGTDARMDMNIIPEDATSIAQFTLFRATDTTGTKNFVIFKGDNTVTSTFVIDADTGNITTAGSGHDIFTDYVGAEHVDWSLASQGTIHSSNYVDNDTTYVNSDWDHDQLTNTHNLTTDIDHDATTNFVANEHIDWTTDQGATNIDAGNYTDTDTTYSAGTGITLTTTTFSTNDGQIVHDNLSGFVANEHIDWTLASAGTIHSSNYVDNDTTYTAGTGLALSGTDFSVDLYELTTETTITAGDFIAMVDISDNGSGKITFTNFEKSLTHANIKGVGTESHNELQAHLMLGSGNSAWVPCIATMVNEYGHSGEVRSSGQSSVTFKGTADTYMCFQLPLPTNRGGKKLYLKGLKVEVRSADGNDYVDRVLIQTANYAGGSVVFDDTTNLTSSQSKTYTFTASDVSGKETVIVAIKAVTTSDDQLNIHGVLIDCYYDV